MTDTKDLCEEWVAKNIHKEFTPIDIEDVYKSFDGAWQARGELDAVKIKELEAKLDKAREVLELYSRKGWEAGWEHAVQVLEELDK